jgi:hypothetical protein
MRSTACPGMLAGVNLEAGPAAPAPGRGPAPTSPPARRPAGSRRHRPRGRRTAPTCLRRTPATPGRTRPCRSGWSAPAGRSADWETVGSRAPAPDGRPPDPAGRSAPQPPPGSRRGGVTRRPGMPDRCSARRCAHRRATGRPGRGHHPEHDPAVRWRQPTFPGERASAAPAAHMTSEHHRRAARSARPSRRPNRRRPPARRPSDGRAARP